MCKKLNPSIIYSPLPLLCKRLEQPNPFSPDGSTWLTLQLLDRLQFITIPVLALSATSWQVSLALLMYTLHPKYQKIPAQTDQGSLAIFYIHTFQKQRATVNHQEHLRHVGVRSNQLEPQWVLALIDLKRETQGPRVVSYGSQRFKLINPAINHGGNTNTSVEKAEDSHTAPCQRERKADAPTFTSVTSCMDISQFMLQPSGNASRTASCAASCTHVKQSVVSTTTDQLHSHQGS